MQRTGLIECKRGYALRQSFSVSPARSALATVLFTLFTKLGETAPHRAHGLRAFGRVVEEEAFTSALSSAPLRSWGTKADSTQEGLDAEDGGQAEGLVHFLFLVDVGLSHVDVWRRFFQQAPAGSFRIWAHCARDKECKADDILTLPTATLVPTVPSAYCYDLVTPAVQLMRHALEAHASLPGIVEKFALISDTSLPVKPFRTVHRALTADDDSDICVSPVDDWRHAHVDGVKVFLVKHSQWVILNRPHAEVMVRDWSPAKGWDKFMGWWSLPVSNGSFGSRVRNVAAQRFMTNNGGAYACTDEQAVFATVFGAFEPGASGTRAMPGLGRPVLANGTQVPQGLSVHPPASQSVQGRCRTFTVFQSGRPLGNLTAEITSAINSDAESSAAFIDPDFSHPIVFKHVGPKLIRALRVSPFLFARKFDPGWDSNSSNTAEKLALFESPKVQAEDDEYRDPLVALVEP